MHPSLAITFAALAAFSAPRAAPAQHVAGARTPASVRRQVADALNAADCAHFNGRGYEKFVAARRHAEKALELDPSNRRALYFLARILYAHYGGGAHDDDTNTVLARQVIAAYKRILPREPRSEEAYKVIAAIIGGRRENEDGKADPEDDPGRGAREWRRKRAFDESLPDGNRALAYSDLAEQLLECSRDVPGEAAGGPGGVPAAAGEQIKLERARRCASEAIEMAEAALRLDPGLEVAWETKSAALWRLGEFAASDGILSLKEDFLRQAAEAEEQSEQVKADNERSGRPGDSNLGLDLPIIYTPAAAPEKIRLPPSEDEGPEPEEAKQQMIVTPGAGYETVVTTGVLNGMALSLPQPPDPRGAGERRAGGEVRVRVVVDESGKVISARPLTGPAPLRAAAAAAAGRATFPATRLNCEPVKVVGVLVYEFAGG